MKPRKLTPVLAFAVLLTVVGGTAPAAVILSPGLTSAGLDTEPGSNFRVSTSPNLGAWGLTEVSGLPGAVMSASNELVPAVYNAASANDGDDWAFGQDTNPVPTGWIPRANGISQIGEWIIMDFGGAKHQVSGIDFLAKFNTRVDGTYQWQYTKDAAVNNGSTWTTIGSVTQNSASEQFRQGFIFSPVPDVTGIRMELTAEWDSNSTFVGEIDVYAGTPVPPPPQIVNFDARDLALGNGDPVTVWDGQTAGGSPTFRTAQTPGGGPAVEFDGSDHFGTRSLSPSAAGDFIIAAVLSPTDIDAYHNLIDDDDQNGPMVWVDARTPNTYEANFSATGPIQGQPGATDTQGWDILIMDSRSGQVYLNSPTPTHAINAIAWNGAEFFDLFNRDGGQTFQGLVAELRVYNDAADFGGDFAGLYQGLYAKWMVAIPEPSTLVLLCLGMVGLAGWGGRRKMRERG